MGALVSNQSIFDSIQWKKFKVLDDGFVCLVDCLGDDAAVVQAARVSYGNDSRETPEQRVDRHREQSEKIAAHSGFVEMLRRASEEIRNDDRKLIRYMMRHNHGTPFEMAEVKILVRVPMDTWRQWVRHRTFSINEYSTRYTEAIDSAATTEPDAWRLQSKSNKQGSGGFLDANDDGHRLTSKECDLQLHARAVYEERLAAGVAREQARKDLPLSTYTEAYIKIDLRNMLHFLGLRMDSHAQQEIREYANVIGEQIIKPLFPLTWEAFIDYQFESVRLSRLDILAIRKFVEDSRTAARAEHLSEIFTNEREKNECLEKLARLGFVQ